MGSILSSEVNSYFSSITSWRWHSQVQLVEDQVSRTSTRAADVRAVLLDDYGTCRNTSWTVASNFTLNVQRHEDDTAIRPQPTRQVDYLSHKWREEDLCSSWKYILSQRSQYRNGARLENALLRTWMKTRHNLKTIAPETLSWFVFL